MNMEPLFQSGNIAFVVLTVMLVELFLLRRYLKRAPAILFGLGAGVCLVFALRAALLEQSWMIIATFLVISFAFHMMEVRACLHLANQVKQ